MLFRLVLLYKKSADSSALIHKNWKIDAKLILDWKIDETKNYILLYHILVHDPNKSYYFIDHISIKLAWQFNILEPLYNIVQCNTHYIYLIILST